MSHFSISASLLWQISFFAYAYKEDTWTRHLSRPIAYLAMVFSWQRLKLSFKSTPQVIKEHLPVLLLLQGTNFFFNQSLAHLQEVRMSSKEDLYIPLIVLIALVGFIAQSIIKVLWILTVCHFYKKSTDLGTYFKEHLEASLIESLRAFFKALIYGFLLIIPGLVKMVRYHFVVFVVALESGYAKGQVDALKSSEALVRGRFFAVLCLILLFSLVFIPFSTNPSFFQSPAKALSFEAFTFFITAIESIYLYQLYTDLRRASRGASA